MSNDCVEILKGCSKAYCNRYGAMFGLAFALGFTGFFLAVYLPLMDNTESLKIPHANNSKGLALLATSCGFFGGTLVSMGLNKIYEKCTGTSTVSI